MISKATHSKNIMVGPEDSLSHLIELKTDEILEFHACYSKPSPFPIAVKPRNPKREVTIATLLTSINPICI